MPKLPAIARIWRSLIDDRLTANGLLVRLCLDIVTVSDAPQSRRWIKIGAIQHQRCQRVQQRRLAQGPDPRRHPGGAYGAV